MTISRMTTQQKKQHKQQKIGKIPATSRGC